MNEPRFNYRHLFYFWRTASEGGIAKAARGLDVSPSTVSEQLRLLEGDLGVSLFVRVGRGIALTEPGKLVLQFATDVFTAGRNLERSLADGAAAKAVTLQVGVADALPKTVVVKLLEPILKLESDVSIRCVDGPPRELHARLALHELDLVLSDAPVDHSVGVKAFAHFLGACGCSFFAPPAVAKQIRGPFPQCLDGAPLILPGPGGTLRLAIDHWLSQVGVRPTIRGEFADSALLKSFGARGLGVFPAPSVVENEVAAQFRVKLIGRTDDVRDQFFLISHEKRLRNPLLALVANSAREQLFAGHTRAEQSADG